MKSKLHLSIILILILIGCNPNDINTPPGNNMNSLELQLVGQWKLKRTETRSFSPYLGTGDSLRTYCQYFNYNNARLDLSSTPTYMSNGHQSYSIPYYGFDDEYSPDTDGDWYGDEQTNSVSINSTLYHINYLSADSLVYEANDKRYFFSKNSTPPTTNTIETQLLGTWLITNGLNPLQGYDEFYLKFYNLKVNPCEYLVVDSIIYLFGGGTDVSTGDFYVLHPERTIPILVMGINWFKITNLSANSLTIERFDEDESSVSIDTLVLQKQ